MSSSSAVNWLGINVVADPRRMALVRLAVGSYILIYLSSMWRDIVLLFSSSGVYASYGLHLPAPSPSIAIALFALMWLSALYVTIGRGGRLAVAILLVLYLHHYFLQLAIKHSAFERLLIIVIAILGIDPGQGAYRLASPPSAVKRDDFGRHLIMIQLMALYLGAGLWKVFGPNWQDGRLLRATFQGMFATAPALAIARLPLSEATWSACARGIAYSECLLALSLLARPLRPFAMAAGLGFHTTVAVLLSIPEFFLCVAMYPAFLGHAGVSRVDRMVSRLRDVGSRLVKRDGPDRSQPKKPT